MDEECRIVKLERPDDAAWAAIGGGLHEYNTAAAGASGGSPVCFLLMGPQQRIAGGIIGETHWDWLYVNLLFVVEDHRGRGHGRKLLAAAEEEARGRGAQSAYLDTFSFQAPGFYEKLGYEVFGVLPDFPPGHERLYMVKRL